MEQNDKKVDIKKKAGIEKVPDTDRKEQEALQKQLILKLTEEKTENKFSDKHFDREHQKVELLSGKFIDVEEVKNIISAKIQAYSPKFPNEFYKQIDRLNNRPHVPNQHPHIYAKWTNELIYGRYSKDVLPTLQTLNPYIAFGVRGYKHHQHLTEEGQRQLETFIAQAITLMGKCNTWYEFRVKMFKEYAVEFQMDAFEDTDNIK